MKFANKTILLLTLILLISSISAYAEMSSDELKAKLRDQGELNKYKDTVNSYVKNIPSILIGKDRVYHARVSSVEFKVILKNKVITEMTTGAPGKSDYYIDTRINVLRDIINSNNPVMAAIDAFLTGKIKVHESPACNDDSGCADNEVCTRDGCERAFTIAVVPIAYSSGDKADFMEKAESEIDLVEKYIPAENFRIHYVDPSICPDYKCTDVCSDCQTKARQCASKAGLTAIADKVAAVSKDDVYVVSGGQKYIVCGCAGGIPSYTSVSRARLYAPEGIYCYNTVTHEMGHQVGLYHVDATGEEGGACQGPNAADCSDPNKMTDIMGYSSYQTHFGPAAVNYMETATLASFQG